MIRPILLHPDPRLKKLCAPVSDISSDLGRLSEDLLQTMYHAPGVGLAAPQIGVHKRVFVMDCVKDPSLPAKPMVLINPEITWASEDQNIYEEGCLSLPNQFGDVERPAIVLVRFTGLDGLAHEEEFKGLWATCAQHEIDHLDGRLFIDRLGPLKRQMITRKMEKYKRDLVRNGGEKI
ncbi:MAG: peptide deformylase [Paracoccaceae bacterium]|jgi:peptide deformylase